MRRDDSMGTTSARESRYALGSSTTNHSATERLSFRVQSTAVSGTEALMMVNGLMQRIEQHQSISQSGKKRSVFLVVFIALILWNCHIKCKTAERSVSNVLHIAMVCVTLSGSQGGAVDWQTASLAEVDWHARLGGARVAVPIAAHECAPVVPKLNPSPSMGPQEVGNVRRDPVPLYHRNR